MKNVFAIIFLALLAFSCETETNGPETTLGFYAIQACGQETDIGAETPTEWATRMLTYVEDAGIEVLSYALDFEEQGHQGWCGNCQRTGDIVRITVDLENEQALRDLGFVD